VRSKSPQYGVSGFQAERIADHSNPFVNFPRIPSVSVFPLLGVDVETLLVEPKQNMGGECFGIGTAPVGRRYSAQGSNESRPTVDTRALVHADNPFMTVKHSSEIRWTYFGTWEEMSDAIRDGGIPTFVVAAPGTGGSQIADRCEGLAEHVIAALSDPFQSGWKRVAYLRKLTGPFWIPDGIPAQENELHTLPPGCGYLSDIMT